MSFSHEQVKAYLARIGYEDDISPSAQTLRALQTCHFQSVPYENLDILSKKRLCYDPDALYEKIVTRRRGGFCFELNAAFGYLLSAMGFEITCHFARFLLNEPTIPMRRHQVLSVRIDERRYLADVGVGVPVPRQSIALLEGAEQIQPMGVYRLDVEQDLGWVLNEKHKGQWRALYSFTEESQLPIDYLSTSFYCENAPESIFNKENMVAIATKDGRVTLDGNTLKIFNKDEVKVTLLCDEQVPEALHQYFGLQVE